MVFSDGFSRNVVDDSDPRFHSILADCENETPHLRKGSILSMILFLDEPLVKKLGMPRIEMVFQAIELRMCYWNWVRALAHAAAS